MRSIESRAFELELGCSTAVLDQEHFAGSFPSPM